MLIFQGPIFWQKGSKTDTGSNHWSLDYQLKRLPLHNIEYQVLTQLSFPFYRLPLIWFWWILLMPKGYLNLNFCMLHLLPSNYSKINQMEGIFHCGISSFSIADISNLFLLSEKCWHAFTYRWDIFGVNLLKYPTSTFSLLWLCGQK